MVFIRFLCSENFTVTPDQPIPKYICSISAYVEEWEEEWEEELEEGVWRGIEGGVVEKRGYSSCQIAQYFQTYSQINISMSLVNKIHETFMILISIPYK